MSKGVKRVIVKVGDGLGNQLFNYAFGYAVAKRLGASLEIDTSLLDTGKIKNRTYELDGFQVAYVKRYSYKYVFNPKLRNLGLDKLIRHSCIGFGVQEYSEKEMFVYDDSVFQIKKDTYFSGYWQNHRYFDDYREDLQEMIRPSWEPSDSMKKIQEEMRKSYSVALHVRRGDYVTERWNLSMNFYDKALQTIRDQVVGNIKVFVFTDDADFAKDYFKDCTLPEMDFIFPEYESSYPAMDDLTLMREVNCNIIANSTFSWWAAYLNNRENHRVICPDYDMWTGEFYPDDWHKICVEPESR